MYEKIVERIIKMMLKNLWKQLFSRKRLIKFSVRKSSENTLRNNWNRIALDRSVIHKRRRRRSVRLWQRRERTWKFCEVFVLRKNISWVSLSRAREKSPPVEEIGESKQMSGSFMQDWRSKIAHHATVRTVHSCKSRDTRNLLRH